MRSIGWRQRVSPRKVGPHRKLWLSKRKQMPIDRNGSIPMERERSLLPINSKMKKTFENYLLKTAIH